MADTPVSGGGGGWAAAEVILAIILAIGLISTLTGNPIQPIFNQKGNSTTISKTIVVKSYTLSGCTVALTSPVAKQTIVSSVDVGGSFVSCVDRSTLPTLVYVQVVDSTGTVLSPLSSTSVTGSIFGNAHFSATVPLSGVAHSTNATVIITAGGSGTDIRIPVKLATSNVPVVTGTTTTTKTYVAPTYVAPTQTTTHSGSSTTF